MGHQVNFYLDAEDLSALERVLRGLGSMQILHSQSPVREPRGVDSVNVEERGQPWLYLYLVREEDLGSLVTNHVPAQGYWTIDVIRSPVVELNRCFHGANILRRGRLYYVDGFYGGDDEWQLKSEAFRAWAKNVLAATKKSLRKHDTDYIGPGAEAWIASGQGNLVS